MINNNYDIVHVKDYYPSIENKASSPWVYDQVYYLKNNYKVLVISPTPYLPDFLRNIGMFYLYPKHSNKLENYNSTHVIRPLYFKVPRDIFFNITFYFLSKSITKNYFYLKQSKIIHAHFGQNGYASIGLKEKLDIPLLTSFYGYDAGRLKYKFKKYYKHLIIKGDLFLVLSEDMKKDLLHLGFPEKKILVHHLGVKLNEFKFKQKKNTKQFIFTIVARLERSKGIQDVIRAFNLIKKENMKLHIVGDGIYKKNLTNLVDLLNLGDNIEFINNFKSDNPREIVVEEMQKCDIFLLTSFTETKGTKEGTPVVLMEAQACKKPCIATKHAGISEIVIDNHTGMLCKERDVQDISKKMKLLYSDNSLRKKMGENALSHIKKNFNHEVQMKKIKRIYNSLINNYAK